MTEHAQPKTTKIKSRLYKLGLVVGGLALVLGIAVVTVTVMRSQPAQQIDASKYQAIYLSSGQMYFGKLQNTGGDFLIIKSPYIAQSVDANADTKTATSSQATLVKVSSQVYGPDDSIAVKSSQVTFWQNLRDDSKVSQAIKAKE